MSWYDEGWAYRVPITVTAPAGGGTIEAEFSIDATFDLFWDNVKSSGEDVRITTSDGLTDASFELVSFNSTTKAATIRFQFTYSSAVSADVAQCFLYWGNAAASTASTTVTTAGAQAAYLEPGAPYGALNSAIPSTPGSTQPAFEIAKSSSESRFVFFQFSDLQDRIFEANGSLKYEEVNSATYLIYQAGTDVTSMRDATTVRFIEDAAGETWLRVEIQGGADANDYTLRLYADTTLGREIDTRGLLKVRDPDET